MQRQYSMASIHPPGSPAMLMDKAFVWIPKPWLAPRRLVRTHNVHTRKYLTCAQMHVCMLTYSPECKPQRCIQIKSHICSALLSMLHLIPWELCSCQLAYLHYIGWLTGQLNLQIYGPLPNSSGGLDCLQGRTLDVS